MSVETVARKFIELVNQDKNFEVMRTMYAPDMVSVEGDGKQTVGQQPVIRKSEHFRANNTLHRETHRGPFFCGDPAADAGRFAVHFMIEVTPHAGSGAGQRITLEEVGLYTVKGDTITREDFYNHWTA